MNVHSSSTHSDSRTLMRGSLVNALGSLGGIAEVLG